MKQAILAVFVALLANVTFTTAQAQTFSKMPTEKRNAKLIKMAKAFYRKPQFKRNYEHFHDFRDVTVSEYVMDAKTALPPYILKKNIPDIGKLQYVVSFWRTFTAPDGTYYGRKDIVRVFISDKLGKAYMIDLPDTWSVSIWDKCMMTGGDSNH